MGDRTLTATEAPVQPCRRQCSEPTHKVDRVARPIAEAGYEGYAAVNGRSQSFERICERAGLSWGEIAAYAPQLVKSGVVKPCDPPRDPRLFGIRSRG